MRFLSSVLSKSAWRTLYTKFITIVLKWLVLIWLSPFCFEQTQTLESVLLKNEKEAQVPESEILSMVISMFIDTQNKVALSENSSQTNRTFQIADLPY